MNRDNVTWNRNNETPREEEHRDYAENLSRSTKFVQKVDGTLPPMMKVCIGSSHHLKNAILWILFLPPVSAKIGREAAPIFLHQSALKVKQEVDYHYPRLTKKAKAYLEKIPTQLELLNAPKTRLNGQEINYDDPRAMVVA